MPSPHKPADIARNIADAQSDPSHAAGRLEQWHVEIYRRGSAVPDIAQTTLPTWRTLRAYIETAKRFWPDAAIEVTAPGSARETALTELKAMGVETSRQPAKAP